jgi:uncharacterized protein with NRDE domain
MCLILFAWRTHPRYPLVLAANRDEFHERPTAAADWWPDAPGILGGRDLQAGGTWLGLTRSGRFAAVTNFREPQAPEVPLGRSRGELVSDFLLGDSPPAAHARAVQQVGAQYRGFNLLVGTPAALVHASNRQPEARELSPGVHGLSNHLLDTDWPKVRSGKSRLQKLLDADCVEAEELLELLTDRASVPGDMPLDLGDGAIRRHLMNHHFIQSPDYGTRSSTVLLFGAGGRVTFAERRFAPDGSATGTSRFDIELENGGSNAWA